MNELSASQVISRSNDFLILDQDVCPNDEGNTRVGDSIEAI